MVWLFETKRGWLLRGFAKKEGINYEETFDPIVRLEAMLLLAFAASKGLSFFKRMSKVLF